VPQTLYTPIEQQAVRLTDKEPANAFIQFLRGEEASNIIRSHGYDLPK
jgi:ABC-type molybdate transport system substrate-binding protein